MQNEVVDQPGQTSGNDLGYHSNEHYIAWTQTIKRMVIANHKWTAENKFRILSIVCKNVT